MCINVVRNSSKMRTAIFLIFVSLSFHSTSQILESVSEGQWNVADANRCYQDTITRSVWITIATDQPPQRLTNDTSFIIVNVKIINKSPIDIYVEGSGDRLKAPVIQENYIPDSARMHHFAESGLHFRGKAPDIIEQKLAFNSNDYMKNPFKDLWQVHDQLIRIEKGTRKTLRISIPKRNGNYRIETLVHFRDNNKSNCVETESGALEELTIQSNRVRLIKL